MKINTNYVNQSQLDAVSRRSLLQNKENDYAAYKQWPGLSDYAITSDMEDAVVNWMRKCKEEYRQMTENLEFKYPGADMFCRQKEFIERSVLFEVFREMPKCSLLHIHNAAALSTDGFISLLKDWAKSCDEGTGLAPIYIVVKPGGSKIPGTLLYNPDDQLQPFCESLSAFFKIQGAEEALKNLISFSYGDRAEGISYIWDEFNEIFKRTGALLENSDFYYYYHYRAFMEMIEDRIEYTELRCSFTPFWDLENTPQSFEPWNLEEWNAATGTWICRNIPFLDKLTEAANAARNDWNKTNPDDERKFSIGVILSARRDLNVFDTASVKNQGDKLLMKMDAAISMLGNPNYSKLIKGFDLVSEEDRGEMSYPLFSKGAYEAPGSGYTENGNIVNAAAWQARSGYGEKLRIQLLDFYLHDGESLWAQNDNMYDADVICPHRIGHGFNLAKYPALTEIMASRAQANDPEPAEPFLEICPISNQMLRYFTDLRAHSAYELMKSGIQCVLGNDDPMILGNPGLSYDFWEAYVGMELDMNEIKGLVFNAYVCEYLADRSYPIVQGADSYAFSTANMIQDFNDLYWGPFLIRAYNMLHQKGLI